MTKMEKREERKKMEKMEKREKVMMNIREMREAISSRRYSRIELVTHLIPTADDEEALRLLQELFGKSNIVTYRENKMNWEGEQFPRVSAGVSFYIMF